MENTVKFTGKDAKYLALEAALIVLACALRVAAFVL